MFKCHADIYLVSFRKFLSKQDSVVVVGIVPLLHEKLLSFCMHECVYLQTLNCRAELILKKLQFDYVLLK